MHTISDLVTAEMTQIRNDIEFNYQNMTPEKIVNCKLNCFSWAHFQSAGALNEAHNDLTRQAASLNQTEILKDENFAQQLMNCILSAMNSIGVLERHHIRRLQLRVNNMNISLDRLDEAHEALLNETKLLIDAASQTLVIAIDPFHYTS